jgi:hypothetical protein
MATVFVHSKRSESLPEVPWVMGDPNASYKWQVSVAGGKKKRKGMRLKSEKLDNVVIKIALKGKKKPVRLNILKTGVEEDFNPIVITSDVLRALHYIKLKEIKVVRMGRNVQYDKRTYSDFLKLLEGLEFEGNDYYEIRVDAILKSSIETKVRIQKVHKKGGWAITIGILGRIEKERVNKLTTYLKKHLPIDKLDY